MYSTAGPGLRFMLRGRTYLNNTIVLITDIGEDDNALLCVTDKRDCCRTEDGQLVGEFYTPDNNQVGVRSSGNSFYRNRGLQIVRLNRRDDALSPTGRYRCMVPDSSGRSQNLYINIVGVS